MKHTVITGHYGSGKTNIAVNLALNAAKKSKKPIYLIDADIVNPYFRAADSENLLRDNGITLIAPLFANTNLDVPALPPEIFRVFEQDCLAFWDVGGDDAGAIALGRYADNIQKDGYEMLYVVNYSRPLTSCEEDMTEIMTQIETASHLKASAIIDNSNLGSETTEETVTSVTEKVENLSRVSGLPIKYRCVMGELAKKFPDAFPLMQTTKKLW